MNQIWRIAIGDYDFALDRRALTYSLTETKTGTVWADNLKVGWIEMEEVATETRTRYDFGQAKVVSLSEKSGPQGKRILIGLDLFGVPLDLYFICSPREIQLTLEASRDTRTHRVQDIGLFPGLVSVPDDGASYLVIPYCEGVMAFARDIPTEMPPLPIWDGDSGVSMPFIGAVRCDNDLRRALTALTLITDSAYGRFAPSRTGTGSAYLDTEYARDPERRHLDLRLVLTPNSNHVAVAKAYRDKIINERNHVTLRRKIRERSSLADMVGTFAIAYKRQTEENLASTLVQLRSECGIGRAIIYDDLAVIGGFHSYYYDADHFNRIIHNRGYLTLTWESYKLSDKFQEYLAHNQETLDLLLLVNINDTLEYSLEQVNGDNNELLENSTSRWDEQENRLQIIEKSKESIKAVGTCLFSDWNSVSSEFWFSHLAWKSDSGFYSRFYSGFLPLTAVVYHDSLICYNADFVDTYKDYLYTLLHLSLPNVAAYREDISSHYLTDYLRRTNAILSPLHELTFPAFMTEHRLLTVNLDVQEAVYSDKTRVVINQSETDAWESDDLHLPPLGFYVRHTQMEAHDALRVGERTFATRAWRIRRAHDGLPLETSQDVRTQEFPLDDQEPV